MKQTQSKLTAIGLAVLMLLSVFAMPAAAAAQPSVSADTDSVTASPGETFTVTYTVTNSGDQTNGGGFSVSTPSGVVVESVSGDATQQNPFIFPGLAPGETWTVTYTFRVTDTAQNGTITAEATLGGNTDTTSTQLTVGQDGDQDGPDQPPEPEFDAEFTKQELNNNPVVFQGQVVAVTGFDAGQQVQLRSGSADDSSFEEYLNADADGTVLIDTSEYSASLLIRAEGVNYGPFEVAPQTVEFNFASDSIREGQTATLEFAEDNRGDVVDVVVSADGLDADELADIFNATPYDQDDDGEDEAVLVEGVQEGDDISADFTGVDTGDYTFTVEVEDTTASDTASIVVNEAVDTDAQFTAIEGDQRGDIAEIDISLTETNYATVTIGDADSGYVSNVTVEDADDDGEVTLLWNTYLADNRAANNPGSYAAPGADSQWMAAGDDTVVATNVSTAIAAGPEHIIATGGYSLEVMPGQGSNGAIQDVPTDLDTVVLSARSTNALNIWTAPQSESFSSADDLADAVGDTVTASDSVAIEDLVVVEVEASGLEGALESELQGDSNATQAFYDLVAEDQVSLTLTQDVGASTNLAPNTVEVSESGTGYGPVTVVENSADDTYYVVLESSELAGVSADQTYDAEFSVVAQYKNDANFGLVAPAEDGDFENEVVVDAFDFVDRSASVNGADAVIVEQAADQTISGTSTLAPGSTLNVRVQSARGQESQFIIGPRQVTVQNDGTWSMNADFSDYMVGTAFGVTVREPGMSEPYDTADGNITSVAQANFQVSNLSPTQATVMQGDSVTVSATVSNTGDAAGDTTVTLTIGGTEIASESVSLDAGAETTVEFTTTADLAAGSYDHVVTAGDASDSGTLTVEAEDDDTQTQTPDEPTETQTPDEPTETTAPGDGDDGTTTSGESGPGFGIAVAVLALLGAALLAARRNE